MVNLTRLATASPPVISAPDINSVLESIFYDCFKPVAEAIAVLIDSAPAGETHVADSLVSLASNQLRSNPTQNQAKLRSKALEDLKIVWAPVTPREQDLSSPLRMLGTLSYEQRHGIRAGQLQPARQLRNWPCLAMHRGWCPKPLQNGSGHSARSVEGRLRHPGRFLAGGSIGRQSG